MPYCYVGILQCYVPDKSDKRFAVCLSMGTHSDQKNQSVNNQLKDTIQNSELIFS